MEIEQPLQHKRVHTERHERLALHAPNDLLEAALIVELAVREAGGLASVWWRKNLGLAQGLLIVVETGRERSP